MSRLSAIRGPVTAAGAMVLLVALLLVFSTDAHAAVSATIGGDDKALEAAVSLKEAGVLPDWDVGAEIQQDYITRAELAVLLARALGLKGSSVTYFSDVDSSQEYFGAVGALREAGLVVGGTPTVFVPDEPVTRRQAVLWVMRCLCGDRPWDPLRTVFSRLSYFEPAERWLDGCKDRAFIGAEYARAVANAFRLGIVEPTSGGWFYPYLPLSWGDAFIMLDRAFVQPVGAGTDYPKTVEAATSYPKLQRGSEGPLVMYLEYRLANLKYTPGDVDGVYDSHTRDAVYAFQKVERLSRTGSVSATTWDLLLTATTPTPKLIDEGTRVEVDLTRQVLFMITDNEVWKIVHVSTGRSGMGTRTGHFSIGAKFKGNVPCVTVSGVMYYPSYIVSKTAIHGYPKVPTYPASHGCIRVPMWLAVDIWNETPKGMTVDVYYNRDAE